MVRFFKSKATAIPPEYYPVNFILFSKKLIRYHLQLSKTVEKSVAIA